MFGFTIYYPFHKGLSSNIMQLIYMFIPPRYGMCVITPVSTSTIIIKDSLTCLTHGLSIIVELVKIVTMISISTISIIATQSVIGNRYTMQVSITYVTVLARSSSLILSHARPRWLALLSTSISGMRCKARSIHIGR